MIHHNFISWLLPFEHLAHGHYLVGVLGILAWIFSISAAIFLTKKGVNRGSIIFSGTALASFVVFLSTAYAMCPVGFVPPGRIYHPDNNTRGLLVFGDGQEKLILEPSFTGNATQFGLVMPLPANPDINEAPEKIFEELENLTNPIVQRRDFEMFAPNAAVQSGGVTVIQQKDVGDYTVTVLTAESATALVDWLNQNGYKYNPPDEANFNYYVQKGGFYFVAMKVNMQAARVDAQGFLSGRLRPIEFAFASPKPMLPIRSMAGDMPTMNFTLYALTQTPYYIPGAEILFSKQLGQNDLAKIPSAEKYQPLNKWLVRNNVLFDPKRINEDLVLFDAGTKLIIPTIAARRVVNPHIAPTESGIVQAVGRVAYVSGTPFTPSDKAFASNLMRGKRGSDVKFLQITLANLGVYPEALFTGYFGPLTYQAVLKLQNQYEYQILTPLGLNLPTGFVGLQTRLVLNQLTSLTQ